MTRKAVYTKNTYLEHAKRDEPPKPARRGTKGSRESALESWCCRWARARGIVVSKLTDPTGVCDRVFWLPGGRPWLVEFKDGPTAPGRAALQGWYREKLARDGYEVDVVSTKERFLEVMGGE